MSKHVWKIKSVGDTIFAYVGKEGNYKATMSEKEILSRLNEHSELLDALDNLVRFVNDKPTSKTDRPNEWHPYARAAEIIRKAKE